MQNVERTKITLPREYAKQINVTGKKQKSHLLENEAAIFHRDQSRCTGQSVTTHNACYPGIPALHCDVGIPTAVE